MKRILRVTALLLCCTLTMSMAGCNPDPAGPTSDTKSYTAYLEEGGVSAPSTPAPTGTPPPVYAAEDDERRYSIHLDGETLTFAADGTIIPQQERVDTLNDLMTGEPMLLTRRRVDVDEQRDENGYPVTHNMTALYDLDGNLLYDWAEYLYSDGFGDYIIRMDGSLHMSMGWKNPELDEHSALWNYKTGEDAVLGIMYMNKLDDHSVLAEDIEQMFLGVVDTDGPEPVFRPAPEAYPSVYGWNGYIIAHNSHGETGTMMDKDFKPILSKPNLSIGFYGLRGNYLTARDESDRKIVLNEKGELLFTASVEKEEVDYFDGELALLSIVRIVNGDRTFTRRMVKTDGTELAGGYSMLIASDENDYGTKRPAPYFIGIKGNTIDILDRKGKVTATKEIPRLDHVGILRDGWYSYTLLPENDKPKENGTDAEGFVGILDSELNIVMPADKYTYIAWNSSWENEQTEHTDLLRCRKKAPGGIEHWDIIDLEGNVIIENLTQVGDAGPNRIAAVKGFNVGLMDRQGNWIAKQSIFDSFEDETEDFF